eukprot:snap_masked-scaffold_13-processed-gene-8.59-mRNA-1 protein AED:1.00 eAED:1.00 QI:0/-1/0/0/-1/1/1/0/332
MSGKAKIIKGKISSIREELNQLNGKLETQSATIDDLMLARNRTQELANCEEALTKLIKISSRIDPSTGKPDYSKKFIESLQLLSKNLEELTRDLEIALTKLDEQEEDLKQAKFDSEEAQKKKKQEIEAEKRRKELEILEKQEQLAKKKEEELLEKERRKLSILEIDAKERRLEVSKRDKELLAITEKIEDIQNNFNQLLAQKPGGELDVLLNLINSNPPEVKNLVLRKLEDLFSGIVKDSTVESYRKLNLENERVNKHFVEVRGGVEVLLFAGFRLSDEKYFMEGTNQLIRKLFLRLDEPDPYEDGVLWQKWYENKRWILHQIQYLRTAHLR